MLSAIAAESESAAAESAAPPSASALSEELSRLRRQNEELAKLALDLAADRRAAALRVADLTRRFGHLASQEEEDGGEEVEEEAKAAPSPSPPAPLASAPPVPPRSAAAAAFDPSSEPPFEALPWPPAEGLLSQAAAAIRGEGRDGGAPPSAAPRTSSPRLLVVPAGGAAPGEPALLLYDASGGPLAAGAGGTSTLRLRVGVNGWADSVEAAAERVSLPSLPSGGGGGGGEWWGVSLAFPRLLGSVAAVARRGDVYDNNGGADFSVPVASPFASGGDGGQRKPRARIRLEQN